MIAKKIPRRKGTSSAARLVRYMVAAQGGLEPESWKRTADYILDTKKTTTQGEKVASYRVTNCGTDDPAQATTVIEATQAANTRSKGDRTYHLVYSFPPGEHPPLDVLHAIEDELCAAIGLADHQRISAVHQDTDHLHVHVAINKVHPTGLQNIEPFRDAYRLMEACERLEVKYGLTRTNHGLEEGRDNERPARIRLDPQRQHDTKFRDFLRQSYNLKIAERPEAKTYNSLRKLPRSGLAHNQGRYSELLPGHARHRFQPRGTEPAGGMRRTGNGTSRAGSEGAAGRPNVTKGIAGSIEAHAGVESLIGYVMREAAPAMRAATSWQQLHAALADHGLQIKQRGAGFIIGDAGLRLWCKASDGGRDLAAKALIGRLGEYQPRDADRGAHQPGSAEPGGEPPGRRYAQRPRHPHPLNAKLFAEYQRERQAAITARQQNLATIRAETAQRRAALKKWGETQRAIAKLSTRGVAKRMLNANTRARLEQQRAAIAAETANKRKTVLSAAQLPNWNAWLMARAQRGDVEALAVLRSRTEQSERLSGDLLTVERADRAKTVILSSLKGIARADGVMSYKTADGGLVLDRATHVQAKEATTGAALVALTLAADRFDGQVLQVKGSDNFRRDVARLAGLHGLNVSFADPAMDAIRRTEAALRSVATPKGPEVTPKEAPPRRPPASLDKVQAFPAPTSSTPRSSTGATAPQVAPAATPAVLEWIKKRNSQRVNLSSIDYNRLWEPKDSGPAVYQGRRKMTDGTEVLLLKRGDEMLVKPATANVVAKASRWRVGTNVVLDARGRFVTASKGAEL